jgi:hypothetical protein
MLCAQSHRPCGNRRILLSCFGVRRQRVSGVRHRARNELWCRGTSPATPLLQSPRVATASFHASHAVHAHVRPGQPLKNSGVAGSFLASATALHIALNPSLTFPGGRQVSAPCRIRWCRALGLLSLTRGASGLHVAQLRRN